MHTQRAAMQQALEALEALAEFTGSMTLGHRYSNAGQMALDALPALREALAEPVGGAVSNAWDEGYRTGIIDEQMSEANIGIAGFNAKVNPARNNPYQSNTSPQPPVEVPPVPNDDLFRMARDAGFVWCDVVEAQFWQALTRFAALVEAREREACAVVAQDWNTAMTDKLADAIRTRGVVVIAKNKRSKSER